MLVKIFIGIIAGIISGLFSTGGGMILVPAFIYLLKMRQKNARSTSILCVFFMVLTTSIFYFKKRYINLELGIQCAIGGIIGSIIGSKFLNKFPDYILRITFIIFLIYVGIRFLT